MAVCNTDNDCFLSSGIFLWFSFTPDVIAKFSVDATASALVRQQERRKLAQELVSGCCKTCNWKSNVHLGNPSNWVRHLRLVGNLTVCSVV